MLKKYHQNAIHIERIVLQIKDLKRSLDFYVQQLGFSILKQTENSASLTTDHQSEILHLVENKEVGPIDQKLGIYHFALLLPNRKDLSLFLKHLINEQIPITGAADHYVSEAIYLQDPDGIGIEIACDRDQDYWKIETNSVPMMTEPFDYSGVYYESADGDAFTKLPKDTIIGHLHLQVNDLNQSEKFYEDIIGFQITSKDFQGAVFMSDEKYHHHLALNIWSKENPRETFENKVGLLSFTIEYPICEKLIHTLNQMGDAHLSYEETTLGYLLTDPDHNKVYLDIKRN